MCIIPKNNMAKRTIRTTQERIDLVERIREMAGNNMSSVKIARRLGVSRNVAMGLCYRNKIELHGGTKQNSKLPRLKPKPKPPIIITAPPKPEPVSGGAGIHILAIGARACRYPIWDDVERPTFIYCGDKAAPCGPYCAPHNARCHMAVPKRGKKNHEASGTPGR